LSIAVIVQPVTVTVATKFLVTAGGEAIGRVGRRGVWGGIASSGLAALSGGAAESGGQ